MPRPIVLIIIVELALLFLGIHELHRLPDGKLHVLFLDVGQGDCVFIRTPSGKQIVIDGGRDDLAIRRIGEQMPFFDRSIDLLILSHPDLDHIFAFPDILRRYSVDRILLTGVQHDLPLYREFLELIKAQKIPLWIADPAKDIDLGDGVTLDILWPRPGLLGKSVKKTNNTSIMLRVLYRSGSVLFTGDGEVSEEQDVLASGADLRADVLKVGHHGSKTSSSTGFLLAVAPKLAVISTAKKSLYGHPHKMILDRFRALGIAVRVTGWEGDIEIRY